ncbi:hypothetical protein LJK88_42470 [Paenibacillus sp. P26]|nr:hypothetical protein LJK88_42470 [Paenibacillus sp. P26]
MGEAEASAETPPSAVAAARAALLKCNLLGGAGTPGIRSGPSKEPPRLTDQQILLQAALKSENKAYAAEIIQSFTRSLREQGALSLKEPQAYTVEANLLLERASRLVLSGREAADLFMPLWISDLDEWERMLIQQWWRLMEEAGARASAPVESRRSETTCTCIFRRIFPCRCCPRSFISARSTSPRSSRSCTTPPS